MWLFLLLMKKSLAFSPHCNKKKSLSFPPTVRLRQSLTYLVTTFAANLSGTWSTWGWARHDVLVAATHVPLQLPITCLRHLRPTQHGELNIAQRVLLPETSHPAVRLPHSTACRHCGIGVNMLLEIWFKVMRSFLRRQIPAVIPFYHKSCENTVRCYGGTLATFWKCV